MASAEPIELKCVDCKTVIGFFDVGRLPRALRASLGALGGSAKLLADKSEPGTELPIVCAYCQAGGR